MQRIKINELIAFRRKQSDRSKRTFANKLRNRKLKIKTKAEIDAEDPRNYWVFSNSTIYNAYKFGSDEYYDPKIDELTEKMLKPGIKSTVYQMYNRNKDILLNFKEFQLNDLRPENFVRQGVQKDFKVLTVNEFPLYVNPSLVFSHSRDGKKEIGSLWLTPQVDGFRKSELGIFCEVLYRFLEKNYSENFKISTDYCIVIDTVNAQAITCQDLVEGKSPFLLDKTINEIKRI